MGDHRVFDLGVEQLLRLVGVGEVGDERAVRVEELELGWGLHVHDVDVGELCEAGEHVVFVGFVRV